MNIDLDVYDRMVMNAKLPATATMKTTQITQLPDDFEPNPASSEFNNYGEEMVGNAIP